jgi:hypothetical protein
LNLHWGALGEVAVVGAGASVVIVVMFACGVVAMARRETAREAGRTGHAPLAAAGLCFLACAGAVLYGIYLIVPQFHP